MEVDARDDAASDGQPFTADGITDDAYLRFEHRDLAELEDGKFFEIGEILHGEQRKIAVMGDEFRILAELPPDAPLPDFYSGFEFLPNDGPTWQVSGLQRNVICPATAATRQSRARVYQ